MEHIQGVELRYEAVYVQEKKLSNNKRYKYEGPFPRRRLARLKPACGGAQSQISHFNQAFPILFSAGIIKTCLFRHTDALQGGNTANWYYPEVMHTSCYSARYNVELVSLIPCLK